MYIALENGGLVEGRARAPGSANVELVFTTAYTGYEESLTDPSYNGQGLIFAYTLIGNYGVDERRFESDEVQPDAVIARKLSDGVADLCQEHDVPAVEHLDTRAIVRAIRENGSLKAGIAPRMSTAQRLCGTAVDNGVSMVWEPNPSLPEAYGDADGPTIALLDCGVKRAMIERFTDRGARVVRLPWTIESDYVRAYDPDLLFVSNGPGDPQKYEQAIETIRQYHGEIPIAGICLGQQLITLALGGDTRKMKFGHRGSNQPVYDNRTKQVRMTTQNHSYEVDTVPEELELVQYNVNDESPEGLNGETVLCRQYHPEANPGPNDSLDFFDDVLDLAT